MRSLTFDELFAMLLAVQLSPADVARLRDWLRSCIDACGPCSRPTFC